MGHTDVGSGSPVVFVLSQLLPESFGLYKKSVVTLFDKYTKCEMITKIAFYTSLDKSN